MAWQPLPEVVEVTVDTPEPKAVTLDPAKTAIVVVDMENYFCKTGNDRSYDVIKGNEILLAKAREAGAKVLYVWSVRQLESPNHTIYHRHKSLMIGKWNTEIVEEIAPQRGETVIPKWSHDVWAWWGIEAALEREGITAGEWTVLVTGVSAAGCANACALGFANRHYDVLIPLDATAASIEAEARTYDHYLKSYKHEIGYTLSTLVDFAPATGAVAEKELAGVA